jgi:hypothetical protein
MRHACGFSWVAMFRRVYRFFRCSLSAVKETYLPEAKAGGTRSQAEKEAPMNQMDYQDTFDVLRRAGFTAKEIDRLRQQRQDHVGNMVDRVPDDQRRLEFIRWLVMTGRLTDYIS